MPASVMTMPEAKKAVQMYAEGYSQPQIAAHLNRSRKAVRTALRQLGVKPRTLAEAWRNQFQPGPDKRLSPRLKGNPGLLA
jgi:DNA-binding NarL/FixJ family response regulator